MDCSLLGSSVHGFPGKNMEWVISSFPGDLPEPGIEPGSPAFQADSLSAEPPEKLSVLYEINNSFIEHFAKTSIL